MTIFQTMNYILRIIFSCCILIYLNNKTLHINSVSRGVTVILDEWQGIDYLCCHRLNCQYVFQMQSQTAQIHANDLIYTKMSTFFNVKFFAPLQIWSLIRGTSHCVVFPLLILGDFYTSCNKTEPVYLFLSQFQAVIFYNIFMRTWDIYSTAKKMKVSYCDWRRPAMNNNTLEKNRTKNRPRSRDNYEYL